MGKDDSRYKITVGDQPSITADVKWTISRAPDTMGYNICSLWVSGQKVSSCSGGGYDMVGTVLGDFIENRFPDELRKLDKPFYGLTFHDPKFKAGQTILREGKTIDQAEAEGELVDLDRIRAFYKASSEVPTPYHTVPLIDGACGESSVTKIAEAIGVKLEQQRLQLSGPRL